MILIYNKHTLTGLSIEWLPQCGRKGKNMKKFMAMLLCTMMLLTNVCGAMAGSITTAMTIEWDGAVVRARLLPRMRLRLAQRC